MGSLYLFFIYFFMKFGRYVVGPILRPYLEGGHYCSMWAWLSTTNPPVKVNMYLSTVFIIPCMQ